MKIQDPNEKRYWKKVPLEDLDPIKNFPEFQHNAEDTPNPLEETQQRLKATTLLNNINEDELSDDENEPTATGSEAGETTAGASSVQSIIEQMETGARDNEGY